MVEKMTPDTRMDVRGSRLNLSGCSPRLALETPTEGQHCCDQTLSTDEFFRAPQVHGWIVTVTSDLQKATRDAAQPSYNIWFSISWNITIGSAPSLGAGG